MNKNNAEKKGTATTVARAAQTDTTSNSRRTNAAGDFISIWPVETRQ